MLVFCIDIGLIMLFKVFEKLWWKFYMFYTKKLHFLNTYVSIISQMFTILKLLNIFWKVEDKQSHTQIPHYCLTKKCCSLYDRGVYVCCSYSFHFCPLPFQSHNFWITFSFTYETVWMNSIQNHFHVIFINVIFSMIHSWPTAVVFLLQKWSVSMAMGMSVWPLVWIVSVEVCRR